MTNLAETHGEPIAALLDTANVYMDYADPKTIFGQIAVGPVSGMSGGENIDMTVGARAHSDHLGSFVNFMYGVSDSLVQGAAAATAAELADDGDHRSVSFCLDVATNLRIRASREPIPEQQGQPTEGARATITRVTNTLAELPFPTIQVKIDLGESCTLAQLTGQGTRDEEQAAIDGINAQLETGIMAWRPDPEAPDSLKICASDDTGTTYSFRLLPPLSN